MNEIRELSSTIYVKPLFIPWSNLNLGKFRLNSFQAEVYQHIKAGHDILAYAPTGGGKTLTLLLSSWLSGEDMPGFVALYPNNTLLKNQMETVKEIIHGALGSKPVLTYPVSNGDKGSVEVPALTVFELPDIHDIDNVFPNVRHVALIALSGRYLLSEDDKPKREVLYEITEKVYKYNRKGGVYVIVFATPDSFLLVYTGAYRDFDSVGKALHNILVAIASGEKLERLEKILRETGALTRRQVSPIEAVAERLLSHPLFIDEFHLYGPYEVDALHAILKLFKERTGLPVVFSSATPADDILKELKDTGIRHEPVKAETSDSGFPVRGPMVIKLLPVYVKKKGLTAYFKAGEALPEFIATNLPHELKALSPDGRALIILDKLWMVTETARFLYEQGIKSRCVASLYDETYCAEESNIIVGSEATTQGVNLGKVVLGAMGGVSAEDVIQRLGRVGRKGIKSTVYLAIPYYKIAEVPPPTGHLDYYGLVSWIVHSYPDYSKRKREASTILPDSFHEIRSKLIYSLGVASIGRVAGNREFLNKIRLTRNDAIRILDSTIGSPEALVKMIVFRRTGFTVEYVDPNGKRDKTSIGLITRNFTIHGTINNRILRIEYLASRNTLIYKSRTNPAHLRGKFIQLRALQNLALGEFIINTGHEAIELEKHPPDTLVYIGNLGRDLSDYLSYTGEGAVIHYGTRGDYALVFI